MFCKTHNKPLKVQPFSGELSVINMNEWKELIEQLTGDDNYRGVISCIEWMTEEGWNEKLQSMISHGRIFISCRDQLLSGTHRSVSIWPCSDAWVDIGFEERWHIGEEENMRREQVKCRHENTVTHFKNFISRLVTDNKSINEWTSQ